MRQWVDKLDTFRYAIWGKLDIKTVSNDSSFTGIRNRLHNLPELNIPFDLFHIFGFMDDT